MMLACDNAVVSAVSSLYFYDLCSVFVLCVYAPVICFTWYGPLVWCKKM